MRQNILLISLFYLALSCTFAFSQKSMQNDTVTSKKEMHDVELKHSIGSSLFILGNFVFDEPVYDFHFHYGYWLTQKDVLIAEVMT